MTRLFLRIGALVVVACAILSFSASPALGKKTLRVMTYNIHVGVGMDKKLDLQRIADVINRERPDLVGLQEVDRGVKRTEGKDEIAELAAMTRMEYAFAPNLDYQGGKYGVAILSRFPIKNTVHRMFENKREAERRGMLLVEVEVERQLLTFVTTHLDYQFEDGRLFETEQLMKHLAEVKGPLIVVADLNDVPTGSAYQMMRTKFDDAWVVSRAKGDGFSYPADKPAKRIDHVFSGRGVRAKKAWVVESLASDHVPVVAELELLRPETQHAEQIDWPRYQDMAVDLMQQYLRIDTSNPPGNEIQAAKFFKRIFDQYGIENEIFEYKPGRANIIARLKGNGSKRPIILLSHTDVVTAEPAAWEVEPFSATIKNDYIYGRGALDMKSEGLLHLMTMILLKREGPPLARDVIFLGTADEEVNDEGSLWMIANKAELFKNAEYLLTEGGDNLLEGGDVRIVGVDVAEKAPFWLRLTATGTPGHGSRPVADSASNRLIRAMGRILDWETPVKLLPAVEKYFKDIAPLQEEPLRSQFANIRESLRDPAFVKSLTSQREYNFLLRNTISITMLSGSKQTNVIPVAATCNIDVRLLPGESPDEFLKALTAVIADPTIKIENVNRFKPPNSSSVATELFSLIARRTKANHPKAVITTKMLSGYTESQLYRQLGITAYGWAPIYTTSDDDEGVHGNNERISVKNVRQGTREFYEVVRDISR
jgi:acetylornithine deacetylase/succinyl-diaminopimelate desuccinylase-like protein/endonuclease/exonuclease/phosphatase family metal-dependent hydrolase